MASIEASSATPQEKAAFDAKFSRVAALSVGTKRDINRLMRKGETMHVLLPKVGLTLGEITFAQVCQ